MERLILLTAVMLMAFGCSTHSHDKPEAFNPGTLVGVHVLDYDLAPGVTEEQLISFFKERFIPEWEKHMPGVKLYITRCSFGEHKGKLGRFFILDSEETRDRYWNSDGSYTEVGRQIFEKVQPVIEESHRLADWRYTANDWVIQ